MRKLLIVLAAFAFVVAYTLPAMADDEWDFYGSARILTFNVTKSKEVTKNIEDEDFGHELSGSARTIGANVKSGDIRGRLELGGTVNLRLAYAYWQFGAGKLLVGHDYTPLNWFPSGQVYRDASMVYYGAVYDGRRPQVKLLLMNDALQIALVQPNAVSAQKATTGVNVLDTDTSMPKLEVGYSLKLGPVNLFIFAGMNSSDDQLITGTTEQTTTIDSNVFGVGFKIPIGALYVNGDVYMATNPKNFGMATLPKTNQGAVAKSATEVEDCDNMTYALVFGYKISDMLTIEAGYGYTEGETSLGGITSKDAQTFTYVQLPITLAKNVVLTPEVGVIDYGDLEVTGAPAVEQGDESY